MLRLVIVAWALGTAWGSERYSEELVLSRLPSQHLAAHLTFSTRRARALDEDFDLFPASLADLVSSYGLHELRLSLTQGLWRTQRWGLPPQPSAPTGAFLAASFTNGSRVESAWPELVESLSGQFCASLSGIAASLTTTPTHGQGAWGVGQGAASRLGLAPRENLCTENLTPWKKLLPCKETGLSVLLNGHRMFETHYNSIALLIRRVCPKGQWSCSNPEWESVQTISVVFDAPVRDRNLDWSLRSIFQTMLPSPCALASSSNIFIDASQTATMELNVKEYEEVVIGGRNYLHLDLLKLMANTSSSEAKAVSNLASKTKNRVEFGAVPPPIVSLHSYLGGSGHQNGRFHSRLTNRASTTVKGVWSQMIPFYTRPFLHSLKFSCGQIGASETTQMEPGFVLYNPGQDRLKPHYFELGLELPGASSCVVELEFERLLLRWTEYPPDAHRGFSVPPPAFRFALPKDAHSELSLPRGGPSLLLSESSLGAAEWVTIWGEVVLVSLPTPDFSMPYNVICLVCTVVALAFGPVHNLTTKSLMLGTDEDLRRRTLKFRVKRAAFKVLSRVGLCPARLAEEFLDSPPKAQAKAQKEVASESSSSSGGEECELPKNK